MLKSAAFFALAITMQLTGCKFIDHDKTLGGEATNYWQSTPFNTPAVMYDDAWLSVPLRTASGFVVGIARQGQQNVLLKIEESSGRVVYRQTMNGFLQSYTRSDSWREMEITPNAPMMIEGPGRYLAAHDREWALIDPNTGNVEGHGTFPAMIPAVSPSGGLCPVGNGFWIAVEDGRDGGVMLSASGALGSERSERPFGCVRIADGGGGPFPVSSSPMQNARWSAEPYPRSLCSKRRSTNNDFCSGMRADPTGTTTLMLQAGGLVLKNRYRWLTVRFPIAMDLVDFTVYPQGIELTSTTVFISAHGTHDTIVQINAAPNSFQRNQTLQEWNNYEVVASISSLGELKWTRLLATYPLKRTRSDARWKHHSVLFASNPASTTQNVYVFKPGMLLAVDQITGTVRWQVGRPLP